MVLFRTGISCLLFVTFSFAQENSKILAFNGGHIRTDMTLFNHLFSPVGGYNAGMGGSLTENKPTALFYNPALFSKKTVWFFECAPGYGVDVGSLADINSRVESSTDVAIQDYKDQSILLNYPFVQSAFKSKTRLCAGGLVVPVKDWRVGAHFYSPLGMQLDGLVSGSAAQINSKLAVSGDVDDVFFNGFVNGHFNLKTDLFVSGLNLTRRISPQWSAGLLLRLYSFSARSVGLMNVEGTMLYGGRENTFNDPNDNWHNDLDQAVNARYKGDAVGWTLGSSYQVSDDISLAAVLEWMPDIDAAGYMRIVNNKVPALNLDAVTGDSEDEIFQAEKLKLSQLTLTEPVPHQTFSTLKFKLPKTVKLGAAWHKKWFTAALSYHYTFSPVSFVYGGDEIGIKPGHRLTAGFDFKYVQTGVGFMTLKKFSRGPKDLETETVNYFLPVFTLGSSMVVQRNYLCYISLVLDPVPALKIGYGYYF